MSVLRARPWTSHEDIVLQRLAAAGKYAAAIAPEMNRSESAIRSRAKKLDITLARAQGEGKMMQNRSLLLGVAIGLFGALAVLTVRYVAIVPAG